MMPSILPILLCVATLLSAAPTSLRQEPAPFITSSNPSRVPNRYIVRTRSGTSPEALDDILSTAQSTADHVFTSTQFTGFAGFLDSSAISRLQQHPDVEFIEQDIELELATHSAQHNVTWGLGRISRQARWPGSGSYEYDSSAGEGTCSYILDTGVLTALDEFEGRASFLKDFSQANNAVDEHGHGTLMAGVIGSRTFGVAKKTNLYAVKITSLGQTETLATMIAGLDFVASDIDTRQCPNGAVVNLSIQLEYSPSANQAVAALVERGIFVAVAAGNYGSDVSGTSPGSEPSACTVGAMTSSDQTAYYSNWGELVDIWAPGENINSTFINNHYSQDGSFTVSIDI
jgi:hypothetical protein